MKVLSSTLVILYLAIPPLARHVVRDQIDEILAYPVNDQIRREKLKFSSGIGLCVHHIKTRPPLVSFICSLTPGSRYGITLWISLCSLPSRCTSLLFLTKAHRAMNPVFLNSALVVSQGKRSSLSRYQNPFVKCEVAASLP